jgi:ABC-type dipeptide/oligopeptide/nickel transport system permease component
MSRYLSRVLIRAVATGITVALAAFALLHFAPGDEAESIAIARVGLPAATPDYVELVRREQKLDSPLVLRAAHWLGRALQGDLGVSAVHGRPVRAELAAALPSTLRLALTSTLLALVLALAGAFVCVRKPGGNVDRIVAFLAAMSASLPVFWIAEILVLVFVVQLGWWSSFSADRPDSPPLALPAVAVTIPFAALGARLLRGALLDVLAQPYIRAARARGLSEWRILWRHALPNALVGNLPLFAVHFVTLLEGAVIVESLVGRPGCGRLLVEAVFARDFPMLLGCLLVTGLLCTAVLTASQLAETLLTAVRPVELTD